MERTPGLEDDFNFAAKYRETVEKILAEAQREIQVDVMRGLTASDTMHKILVLT